MDDIDAIKQGAETTEVISDAPVQVVELKDGAQVQIHKCKTKDVSRILALLAFVMEELNVKNFGDMPEIDLQSPAIILPLLAKATNRVVDVCAALSSLTAEELDELELDDTVTIITRVFEVNKSFFLNSVLPQASLL